MRRDSQVLLLSQELHALATKNLSIAIPYRIANQVRCRFLINSTKQLSNNDIHQSPMNCPVETHERQLKKAIVSVSLACLRRLTFSLKRTMFLLSNRQLPTNLSSLFAVCGLYSRDWKSLLMTSKSHSEKRVS